MSKIKAQFIDTRCVNTNEDDTLSQPLHKEVPHETDQSSSVLGAMSLILNPIDMCDL